MPAIHYFCTMTMRFLSVIAVLAFSLTCSGKDIPKQLGDVGGVPVYEMGVERLPDLSVPRSAHVLAYVNGELTAIGGHTMTRSRASLPYPRPCADSSIIMCQISYSGTS